jgi:N-acetylglucosaminyl-diphospho-decaprenol L-rhamnosyltransferase
LEVSAPFHAAGLSPARTGVAASGADASRPVEETGRHMPVLSIICVNWNSLGYLTDCVKSICEHAPSSPFEIVVVDNASPEGGVDTLRERFPHVQIIKSDRNLGFAGANNLGFRHSRGQYILLLNPDTLIIGCALDAMLDQIRSLPDAGLVGGTLLDSDLSVSTTSIQKFPTILNQLLTVEWLRVRLPSLPFWSLTPLFNAPGKPVSVDVIPGACMMVKRDVFERAGLLSEDYFMYAEDIDLNYKIAKLGFCRYYVPQAQIIHHGGRSSSQQEASQWSTIMIQRAMLRYFRKSRGGLYAAGYRIAMGCNAAVRLFLLIIMLPLAGRQRVRSSIAKWGVILKWALGMSQVQVPS